jgi:hypothetical protein
MDDRPMWRRSNRPFTEAEERMWLHLTMEAKQLVPVEPAGTAEVYRFSEVNVTNIEFDNVPDGMYWLVPVEAVDEPTEPLYRWGEPPEAAQG